MKRAFIYSIVVLSTITISSCKKTNDQSNGNPVVNPNNSASTFPILKTLGPERHFVAVATVGTRILFAGGGTGLGNLSSEVNIYDYSNNTWSNANLTEARTGIGAVTVRNKVLFAGGAKDFDYDNGWSGLSSTQNKVYTYDTKEPRWSITPVSMSFSDGSSFVSAGDALYIVDRGQVLKFQP